MAAHRALVQKYTSAHTILYKATTAMRQQGQKSVTADLYI